MRGEFLLRPGVIDFLTSHDWDNVRARCHALVRRAREAAHAITGVPPLCPDEPGWFAQMAAIQLPACDPDAVAGRLRDEFHIEVPIRPWHGRPILRVSAQAYNTESDIDALISALGQVLSLA